MKEPHLLTAVEMVEAIRSGRLSPGDLLESCLARVAEREPEIRAMAWFDPARLRKERRAPADGPLAGIPVGVKDVFDTAAMPTQYGSAIYRGHQPQTDASVVSLARAAGAVVLGKTVTTEFAIVAPGPTRNPHDVTRTPGGSSSGSAAGVADFYFPLALGTQTAGSTIRPAAFCGVVGYKPTFGIVSRAGLKIMSDSFDTVGLFARSVEDCDLFLHVLSGRRRTGPLEPLPSPPRLGICRSPAWGAAQDETVRLFERLEAELPREGCVVRSMELPPEYDPLARIHYEIQAFESERSLAWELDRHPSDISPPLRRFLAEGRADPGKLQAGREILEKLRSDFDARMAEADVLMTPASPGEAPVGLGSTGQATFNRIWTALHVPCISIPAGLGPNGMPLGLQIVGRRNADRHVLRCAQWLAARMPAAARPTAGGG